MGDGGSSPFFYLFFGVLFGRIPNIVPRHPGESFLPPFFNFGVIRLKPKLIKMNQIEEYQIEVEVRINGLIPKDRNGLNIPRLTFNKSMAPSTLKGYLKSVFFDYEAITPENSQINVYAYVHNYVSDTMMNMASFYGSELRFVKH